MSPSIPLPTLSLTLTKTHFPLLFSPSPLPKPSFSSPTILPFHSKSLVSNCSISNSNSNHSDNDREEQRWLREEQRWLREEQRWARERDSLLREISDLKLHIQALERRVSTHDVSPDSVANVLQVLKDKNLVLDSESTLRRMVLDQNQEEVIEREKEVVVIEEAASATVQKSTTLRKGSEGEQVRELQEALLKLGFYSGEEDMEYFSFSSGTDRAVKTWQAAVGVPEDGIMTAELLERLYLEVSTKDAGNANENTNSATVLPKEGENGAAVASVTEISEVQLKVEGKGDAGIQSSHRGVFLLGENRWEEPSRLVASDGVDRSKNKDATKKCLQCRGEGRLLCTGKLLQAKRPNMFWTPCATHCLDLMLEDIGKIPRIKRAIQRGNSLVGFIYNHTLALNTMRKFTSKAELVRYGVTRFATTFLTLQRLHNQKNNLRKMFTSDDWLKSRTAKETKGKKAADVVLMPTFWNDVIFTLKAMGLLVRVLRLVDNEKKPAMGYIYEAMDRAKEAIQNAFNGDESKYKEICEIIDRRWECQLHHPVHAAGHFLNPEFFYNNPLIELDHEVVEGLHQCIESLSANDEAVDKITNQLSKYKRALGLFGIRSAVRHRTTMAPECDGSGEPNIEPQFLELLDEDTKCPYCDGLGYTPCDLCGGKTIV